MADDQSKRLNAPGLHVGTMGWSYSFWKGAFYPKDLASKDFLAYYSKRINSVEVNSSFYRIPAVKTIADWKQQTPDGFTFSLKFPARITHLKMLKDTVEETHVFLERVSLLGEKLGALLIQLPPAFKQQRLPLLAEFLKTLPSDKRFAVEVRDKSLLNQELYALLHERNVALAWVDAAKMPLAAEATADFVYLRWEGDRKTIKGTLGKTEVDRIADVRGWAEKLSALVGAGKEVFGYFSKFYSGLPTYDVAELMKTFS